MSVKNKAPAQLVIEAMEVGYDKATIRFNTPIDSDATHIAFWSGDSQVGQHLHTGTPHLFARGSTYQSSATPVEIATEGNVITLSGLSVLNNQDLALAHIDKFILGSNPASKIGMINSFLETDLDAGDSPINITYKSDVATAVPVNIENITHIPNQGDVGNPMGVIQVELLGSADSIEIQLKEENEISWVTYYSGDSADLVEISARPGTYNARVISKAKLSKVVDSTTETYLNTVTVGSSLDAPNAPNAITLAANKIKGTVPTYNLKLSWTHTLGTGGTPRNYVIHVLENPAKVVDTSTLDWSGASVYTSTEESFIFSAFPYRKHYAIRVGVVGYGTANSAYTYSDVYLTEDTGEAAEQGYLVPAEDAYAVSTNIQVDPSQIVAYSFFDGNPANNKESFRVDAATGNVTIGESAKGDYGNSAPFLFDAANNSLIISGTTISDKINAATIELSWLGGVAPSIKTVGKDSFTSTTEGLWAGYSDASTFQFALGDGTSYLKWDGTDLRIAGSVKIGEGSATLEDANRYTRFEYSVDGSTNWSSTLDSSHKYFRTIESINGVDQTPSGATLINMGATGSAGSGIVFSNKADPTVNSTRDADFTSETGRAPVSGDTLVYTDSGLKYNGSTWAAVTAFIGGSLIVNGSITSKELDTDDIFASGTIGIGYTSEAEPSPRITLTGVGDKPITVRNPDGTEALTFSDSEGLKLTGGLGPNTITSIDSIHPNIQALIVNGYGGGSGDPTGGVFPYSGTMPYALPTTTAPSASLDITLVKANTDSPIISVNIKDSKYYSNKPNSLNYTAPSYSIEIKRGGTTITTGTVTGYASNTQEPVFPNDWSGSFSIDETFEYIDTDASGFTEGTDYTYSVIITRTSTTGVSSNAPKLVSYSVSQTPKGGGGGSDFDTTAPHNWTGANDFQAGLTVNSSAVWHAGNLTPSSYLTTTNAASTYLTITNAESTYLTITDSQDFVRDDQDYTWDFEHNFSGGLLKDGKEVLAVGDYNLGKSSTSLETLAATDWARNIGHSTMAKSDSVGMPVANHGYWQITGRRDSGGGYSGIFTEYNTGRAWVGYNTVDTSAPHWDEIATLSKALTVGSYGLGGELGTTSLSTDFRAEDNTGFFSGNINTANRPFDYFESINLVRDFDSRSIISLDASGSNAKLTTMINGTWTGDSEFIFNDRAQTFSGKQTFENDIDVKGGIRQDGFLVLNGTDTWLRTTGSTGWFSASYGGGIFMQDSTWVRIYNNKKFHLTNTEYDSIYTLGGFRGNSLSTANSQQLVLNAGESAGKLSGQTNEFIYMNAESGVLITESADNWATTTQIYEHRITNNFSRLNSLSIQNGYGGSKAVGLPANAAKSWYVEKYADPTNHEASTRMMFTEHNQTTASADNYGISFQYDGAGTVGSYPSGAARVGANARWEWRRHSNNIDGTTFMWGSRDSSDVHFVGKIYADAGLVLGNDSSTSLTRNSAYMRWTSTHGYVDIGSGNSTWMHFYTDRSAYWFNKKITVETGLVSSYDEDLQLQRVGTTKLTLDTSGAVVTGRLNATTGLQVGGIDVALRGGAQTITGSNNFTGGLQKDGVNVLNQTENDTRYLNATGGTLDGGTNTFLTLVSDDGGRSEIAAYGGNQGTGVVYVGQDASYGGGIEYNGDGTPTTTGAGSDYITLFRESVGTRYWTARNYHSNNDWEFRGGLKVANAISLNETTSHANGGDDFIHVLNPDGAQYSKSGTDTGLMKIILPVGWTSTMLSFWVDIYDYQSGAMCSFHVGGYNYSVDSSWYNTTATQVGGNKKHFVTFGYENNKCVVAIGDTTTAWTHVKVQVRNFMAGYNSATRANWAGGWDIVVNNTPLPVGTATAEHDGFAYLDNRFAVTSGLNATGTWPISVTGNAATADSATNATNAGYATTSDKATNLKVEDARYETLLPNYFTDKSVTAQFTNENGFSGLNSWYSALTVKGWEDAYQTWQLVSGADSAVDGELYYRRGRSAAWDSTERIFMDSYHPNADKWTNSRTLTLTGDASGNVSFDGGSAIPSLNVTVNDSNKLAGNFASAFARADSAQTFNYNVTVSGSTGADLYLTNGAFIRSQDENKYIWATGTSYNWGIYWNTTLNKIEFRGAGAEKAYIDLDTGDIDSDGKISSATLDVSGSAELGSLTMTSALQYKTVQGRESLFNSLHKVTQIGSLGVALGKFNDGRDDYDHRWFIADEVALIMPEVVRYKDNKVEALNYTEMLPDAYAAIAEQQHQIDDLKSEVQMLKNMVQELLNNG